jgi:type III secretion protein HrpB1
MTDIQCSPKVLGMLLSIFGAGLRIDARADMEELLLALRLLHPKPSAVDICEVRLLVNSRKWIEALRLLIQIEEHEPGSPAILALQGWCLYVLGDKDWRRCVAAVLRSGDSTGIAIAARFLEVSGESVAERIAEVL